jgi:Asp-tRNA(Asn)/Glu-tRNA(Gln) amidotransferase C subunit
MDLDAIQKLIESISSPITCYFYYNTVNGQVIKITNYFEESSYSHIEIPATEVDPNLSINDYQVIRKDEKFELVKRDKFIDNVPKIDDNIHQIYKRIADSKIKISQVNYSFDMLIEQDNIKKEFRIRVSEIGRAHV